MMNIIPIKTRTLLTGAVASLAVASSPAVGQDTDTSPASTSENNNRTYVELGAGLGYGTNPLLRVDGRSSGYVRVSALVHHQRVSDRAITVLTAYGENNSYFRGLGSKQLFALNGSHRYEASETVSVFGGVGFTADFGGQLIGRIYGEPVVAYTIPEAATLPPPTVDLIDPGTVVLNQRQYRVNGQVGADFRLTERDSLTIAAGADFNFFSNDGGLRDYHSFSQSIGWNRRLSERSSIGAFVSFREIDYPGKPNSAFIINPSLVYRTNLAENWSANFSAGVLIDKQRTPFGNDTDVAPSFSVGLCKSGEVSRLCINGGHTIQSSGSASSLSTTNFNANYYQRLSAETTFRLNAGYSRYNTSTTGFSSGTSHFFTASAGVSHQLSDRLYLDGQAGVRKLSAPGPNPKTDVQGTISLKYRLGDL